MTFLEGVASRQGGLTKGVSLYMALFNVITYTFSKYDQSRPLCISSVAVGMQCYFSIESEKNMASKL